MKLQAPFPSVQSTVKASPSCDNFDSLRESLCALLLAGDMPGPNTAELCGRWALPPQAKKSAVMIFVRSYF